MSFDFTCLDFMECGECSGMCKLLYHENSEEQNCR